MKTLVKYSNNQICLLEDEKCLIWSFENVAIYFSQRGKNEKQLSYYVEIKSGLRNGTISILSQKNIDLEETFKAKIHTGKIVDVTIYESNGQKVALELMGKFWTDINVVEKYYESALKMKV